MRFIISNELDRNHFYYLYKSEHIRGYRGLVIRYNYGYNVALNDCEYIEELEKYGLISILDINGKE